ncbi:Ubiquitin-protein ligase E3A [Trichoplax sp. H2]|nr:Ubiquitin-protein ligase E3A [Trichoplax sp. H2]|eukprot:RDD45965.1 Ubiquitin-protein ligase E3A [Trichoplax sp. H2]
MLKKSKEKDLFAKPQSIPSKRSSELRRQSVDDAQLRGSILITGAGRSVSVAHLNNLSRPLSASNLAALSDSNLSVQAALLPRSYNKPNTNTSQAKQSFVSLVSCYYGQLTIGCEKSNCRNKFCRSNEDFKLLSSDMAAIVSIELASRQRLFLCSGRKYEEDLIPDAVFKAAANSSRPFLHALFSTSPFKCLFRSPYDSRNISHAENPQRIEERWSDDKRGTDNEQCDQSSISLYELSLTHLTYGMVKEAIDNYTECGDPAFLVNTFRTVFSSSDALNDSFLVQDTKSSDSSRMLNIDLDLRLMRRTFEIIMDLKPLESFKPVIIDSIEILLTRLENSVVNSEEINQFIILLECPLLMGPQGQDLLDKLCKILANSDSTVKDVFITKLIKYDQLGFKRILKLLLDHLSAVVHTKQRTNSHNILIVELLGVLHSINMKAHFVSLSEFYSDDLSRKIDFKEEHHHWITSRGSGQNSLIASPKATKCLFDYPFLFNPAAKVNILHLDAMLQMKEEYQDAFIYQAEIHQAQMILQGSERERVVEDSLHSIMCPFLVLEVRRDYLIEDTMQQIRSKESDLKKPLKIKYVGGGEQGLDMGGLQKEFFHLIVDCIFDPSYGMFTYIEESRKFWIDSASLESEREFELVGIILGLAIYNGVILDIHFPQSIYKKLQGEQLHLKDLIDVQPTLGASLQELLEYDGDVEDIFCFTFEISYMSLGRMVDVELKPRGSLIPVTNENREEFVNLYIQHLLVNSIEKQFQPFSRGFHKVCGGDTLTLFRAEELDLVICGSNELDFDSLERTANYDGYTCTSVIIVHFWELVHAMNEKHKKLLLMFVTGSDRVPLKGLGNLKIIIQRNGGDSNRLPTAMTCFNRLLLPDYKNKNKLEKLLLLAIENGKGFGLT